MSLTITPPWENPIWYETDVQLALRDLTKRGNVLFDVGANIGGLSSPAARFVGPSGKVIAFEASPRTISTLHGNMALTHSTNVHIEFAAVCDVDNSWLPFYYGHIPNADSLSDTTGNGEPVYVKTLTLDTYCRENNLEPNVIKMDIEGAEYLALKGFERYIDRKKPPFVLEVGNTGSSAHSWLCEKGYESISLSSYSQFRPSRDSSGHSNVLYIHPLSKIGGAYRNCDIHRVSQLTIDNLISNGEEDHTLQIGQLEAGRYIVEIDATEHARTESGQFEIALGIPNQLLSLHIAPMNVLATNRWQLPIHIDQSSQAYILMKRLSEPVIINCIKKITIFQVFPGEENWS